MAGALRELIKGVVSLGQMLPFLRDAAACGVELGAMEPAGHGVSGRTARAQLGFLLGGEPEDPASLASQGRGVIAMAPSTQAEPALGALGKLLRAMV